MSSVRSTHTRHVLHCSGFLTPFDSSDFQRCLARVLNRCVGAMGKPRVERVCLYGVVGRPVLSMYAE
jgi:hypothetical protein